MAAWYSNVDGDCQMSGRVAGKVALVTGGASGLGEAISQLLSSEGAKVVVADIDEGAGQRVVKSIVSSGGEASFTLLDVGCEEQWKTAMDTVVSRYGTLHILVNNAGIAPVGDMMMPFEKWRFVMRVNLDGTFLGMQAAIAVMRENGHRCSIVNISSIMAMAAEPTTAAYSASKGGVRSLTKAGALYCGSQKLPIRVNSIHPGMCVTPLVEDYFKTYPEQRAAHLAKYPIGNLGEPLDIAQGVLYLASDESKFVFGSELVIDGGFLAQ